MLHLTLYRVPLRYTLICIYSSEIHTMCDLVFNNSSHKYILVLFVYTEILLIEDILFRTYGCEAESRPYYYDIVDVYTNNDIRGARLTARLGKN